MTVRMSHKLTNLIQCYLPSVQLDRWVSETTSLIAWAPATTYLVGGNTNETQNAEKGLFGATREDQKVLHSCTSAPSWHQTARSRNTLRPMSLSSREYPVSQHQSESKSVLLLRMPNWRRCNRSRETGAEMFIQRGGAVHR